MLSRQDTCGSRITVGSQRNANYNHHHQHHVTQNSHNQAGQANETPTWEAIAAALKSLFSDLDQVDLSRVGAAQRLQYEDFEPIFYHLFLLIEPAETKRRFRTLCAARNQEERAKFIELAVRFINDKQLHSQRVSSSQLRMFGGEPFRRLTGSLIRIATERELDKNELNIEDQMEREQCHDQLAKLMDVFEAKSDQIADLMQQLNQSMEQLRESRKNLEDSNQAIEDKWYFMSRKLNIDVRGTSPPSGSSSSLQTQAAQSSILLIVRTLMAQFGTNHTKTKEALRRVMSIELPRRDLLAPPGGSKFSSLANQDSKRLSQLIRDVVNKFDTNATGNQQDPTPADQDETKLKKTKLREQMRQQLVKYDQGLERLIETWREEEERMEEEMLQTVETRELFQQLQELIPPIRLTPIKVLFEVSPDQVHDKTTDVSLKLNDIENILREFPDKRYDDQEILEITRKYAH